MWPTTSTLPIPRKLDEPNSGPRCRTGDLARRQMWRPVPAGGGRRKRTPGRLWTAAESRAGGRGRTIRWSRQTEHQVSHLLSVWVPRAVRSVVVVVEPWDWVASWSLRLWKKGRRGSGSNGYNLKGPMSFKHQTRCQ
ncbi:hypothetical protein CMUS01_15372 [Colletotrichum musicola]|uniref:Uncharacterized protein n=1 Tax=Colletotrichum musicola TaxID=2175873 RepID=A0A8H6IXK3_9PEZI|nr:hypothetical protein CMUS01_15372 [Colletotrichum musicola]